MIGKTSLDRRRGLLHAARHITASNKEVKGKFVFNAKGILERVEEAEVEASKGKSKKRRITKAITPEIEDEEEEGIKNSIYESESDCIIVASSRSISK
jgi:hypothetical protein